MESQTNTFSNYLSLVKFSHTIFALPFAIIGYFLAIAYTEAQFDIKLFVFVVLYSNKYVSFRKSII